MSDDHKILKGIGKGLGQLGLETIERVKDESEKISESVITGKQLLGLDNTMGKGELDFERQMDAQKSAKEIEKLKGEMGQGGENKDQERKQTEKGRNVEEELKELDDKKKKEEEEKEKYYEEKRKEKEQERQKQEEEYNDSLMMGSSNPAKQKKSRGSAFAKKKKSQPDQSQMSQTSEFKGKID